MATNSLRNGMQLGIVVLLINLDPLPDVCRLVIGSLVCFQQQVVTVTAYSCSAAQ